MYGFDVRRVIYFELCIICTAGWVVELLAFGIG